MKNVKTQMVAGLALLFCVGLSAQLSAQTSSSIDPIKPSIQVNGIEEEPGDPLPPPPILSTIASDHDIHDVEVYPNPNAGNFTLKINDFSGVEEIIITNIIGNVVLKKNIKELNQLETEIDLGNVSPGIYLLSTGKELIKFKVL